MAYHNNCAHVSLQLVDAFVEVRKEIERASKSKEEISGEGYDIEFVKELSLRITSRQEMWKYVGISRQCIRDWKRRSLKKVRSSF